MLERRTFLKWAAVLPAGALGARHLSACTEPETVNAIEPETASEVDPETASEVEPETASEVEPETASEVEPDTEPRVCVVTEGDALGPFYVEGAPAIVDLAGGEPGAPLGISGVVTDTRCAPIPAALVEVWQADAQGDYHDDRLRATITCNAAGAFAFTTIMPGRYLQANGWRPAHLHFKVSAGGFRTVVTQIYFAGDPYLQPNDSCGSCGSDDPARILELVPAGGRDSARVELTLAPL